MNRRGWTYKEGGNLLCVFYGIMVLTYCLPKKIGLAEISTNPLKRLVAEEGLEPPTRGL